MPDRLGPVRLLPSADAGVPLSSYTDDTNVFFVERRRGLAADKRCITGGADVLRERQRFAAERGLVT